MHKHNGIPPLVRLIQQSSTLQDKELLIAVTGAVWKLAISEENVLTLDELNTIPTLVRLLSYDDETVSPAATMSSEVIKKWLIMFLNAQRVCSSLA